MADVFTLDAAYLKSLRERIASDMTYAQYQVGGVWHKTPIESAKVLDDGRIEVRFLIDHTVTGDITVTGIEVYDRNGTRVASRTVNIQRKDATEGILYVCRFALFQVTENRGKTGTYDKV